MPVPTEAEWGDYQGDPDQTCAHKLFAGRTNQEMLQHFRRNVIERTDELDGCRNLRSAPTFLDFGIS
jgi:hypothetical protein